MLGVENFGCNYPTKSRLKDCQALAIKIKERDKYFGYIAWMETMLDSEQTEDINHTIQASNDLIMKNQTKPEAYLKLFSLYMKSARQYNLNNQTKEAKEIYDKAVALCDQMLFTCHDIIKTTQNK